ncbi:hypothetical protein CBM2598_P30056 [Cupriavidus taiwanensis]|uniref:Uncharacterized protein n=1 Tax=Cupriavidus taiwanensis TaxID=164546 RepID=A0A7Z7JEZ4_9BURK|nr:hypothetical protein CBM2597_P30058 [Cupriavidus taiwanensis]SOZ95810.1 hypothetical protein CBM2598_P30056 [Cupriavidus taiwanensis]SPC25357.1 hypothetical protein CBM2594_P30056 [Cupriavidus taiwanensis]
MANRTPVASDLPTGNRCLTFSPPEWWRSFQLCPVGSPHWAESRVAGLQEKHHATEGFYRDREQVAHSRNAQHRHQRGPGWSVRCPVLPRLPTRSLGPSDVARAESVVRFRTRLLPRASHASLSAKSSSTKSPADMLGFFAFWGGKASASVLGGAPPAIDDHNGFQNAPGDQRVKEETVLSLGGGKILEEFHGEVLSSVVMIVDCHEVSASQAGASQSKNRDIAEFIALRSSALGAGTAGTSISAGASREISSLTSWALGVEAADCPTAATFWGGTNAASERYIKVVRSAPAGAGVAATPSFAPMTCAPTSAKRRKTSARRRGSLTCASCA